MAQVPLRTVQDATKGAHSAYGAVVETFRNLQTKLTPVSISSPPGKIEAKGAGQDVPDVPEAVRDIDQLTDFLMGLNREMESQISRLAL